MKRRIKERLRRLKRRVLGRYGLIQYPRIKGRKTLVLFMLVSEDLLIDTPYRETLAALIGNDAKARAEEAVRSYTGPAA